MVEERLQGTVVTVAGPGPAARRGAGPRPEAGFLAQLLAARDGLPAQRAKRRAAPEVGAAAYRSTREGIGASVRRSLAGPLDVSA